MFSLFFRIRRWIFIATVLTGLTSAYSGTGIDGAFKFLKEQVGAEKLLESVTSIPAQAQKSSKAGEDKVSSPTSGKVIHVDDGDTVAIRTEGQNIKVRLANIDAPETHKNICKPGQPHAQASAQALKNLVHGKDVEMSCHTVDRYGRHICDIKVGSVAVNKEMVRLGLAWANRQSESYLRDKTVLLDQAYAHTRGLGIWSDPDEPVPPWVWRQTQWKQSC